jgi:Tol biopolymer transport system component
MTDTNVRLGGALAGRYRVERELGQGGMATVWLAHDLKHARDVAIKVLHPELAAMLGGERFLTEIRTTAALQHPHILALFDSGEADGLLYYVMPYVEGETLRRRLERERQLPVDVAVRIAAETASALEYAHKRGVVHRDIKPENILLQDGRPLVADFGIALAVQQAGGSRLTQTGMSLGTPQYMAPEQAMGDRSVDARADVYALGAVTYEMLAGEAPFTGPTVQAIVARVMTDRPRPLGEVRDTVSPAVEAAVHRALQKLPADRWQGAGEFGMALQAALTEPRTSAARTVEMPAARRRRVRALAPVALAGLMALGAFLAGRATRLTTSPAAVPSWLAILAPNVGGSGSPALNRQIALTPDGSAVIFVSVGADGVNRLYRQRLESPDPILIENSIGLSNPRVSPDGRWLHAYDANRQRTVRLPAEGGAVEALDAPWLSGMADWSGGDLVWFDRSDGSIRRLVHGDSSVRQPTEIGRDLNLQQILDDGRQALAIPRPLGQASGALLLVDLVTGTRRTVIEGQVVEARHAAGLLAYVLNDGSLRAAPFDARRGQVTGAATTLATGISVSGTGFAQMAFAPNGTLAFIPEEPRSLIFVGRDGSVRPALSERHNFHAPVFAPDGRRLSMDFVSGNGRDVWILSLAEGTLSRATFDRDGHDATWSPDGGTIIYTSGKSGALGVYRTRPGKAEPAESLFALRELAWSGIWTADGRTLVTVAREQREGSSSDIVVLPNGGRGPIQPLVASSFQEEFPALSPGDRWLAFVSNQSGEFEVYVRPFGSDGDQVQVSQGGGTEPVWSPDGKELFYRGAEADRPVLVAAELRTDGELAVAQRRVLFPLSDVVGTNPHPNYSVSPDGRTFAMVRRSPATRIMILQNLPEILRRMRGTEQAAR